MFEAFHAPAKADEDEPEGRQEATLMASKVIQPFVVQFMQIMKELNILVKRQPAEAKKGATRGCLNINLQDQSCSILFESFIFEAQLHLSHLVEVCVRKYYSS